MSRMIRTLIGSSPLYLSWKRLGHRPDFWYWLLRGRPRRTPHFVKQRTVLGCAHRYDLRRLVETGTYYGEMVAAARTHFDRIDTIELDPQLAALARRNFATAPNVHLYEGDSQRILPEILASITAPALFWLDAGYYGWDNAIGSRSRMGDELDSILRHPVAGNAILMDDADALDGTRGAPTFAAVKEMIEGEFPGRQVWQQYNIMHIEPAG